ncbi:MULTISPECIES: ABC transporter ATP-binding protein [unclassified Pseudodesulfovibrio]|uniref:ABC transporter ATP-binding protein n=1 Tax=unclassified Pseudodesulfovibrio TaxID=2661612 RepID=UPI000FEB722A|nr:MULTISPECIES: ABC transporter ATP-binding protein [unclassified Pseudodesulfovibrio]MCJ2163507.1 ABC transporter ATP-binding protein [Pseudodesulfovibrio sp. S3-i]RWU06743.1 ABC transporter ATP-binding protein [Pseudodesulfovibrio sp. S3]
MILSVSEIDFTYGGASVLAGVDFQLDGGELLAILGPNGVGKTTLLKCINAIHRPSAGAVMVEDRNILAMRPDEIALGVGYVAQRSETARLTVFDAVLMGRKPHIRWRPREQDLKIVDAAIKRLDLERLSLRYIDCLSGGELQKVAIARAMVQEPKLMLLDEPTSSLDLKSQVDILTMLRRVVDEHKIGAIMTMHDLNTALRYADKVLFLKEGRIHSTGPACEVTSDTVEEVYGLPVHIHTVQGHPMIVPAG